MSEDPEKQSSAIPGLVTGGSFLIGIMATIMAIMAVSGENDFTGAGVCLTAAALSFGLLANAVFRR